MTLATAKPITVFLLGLMLLATGNPVQGQNSVPDATRERPNSFKKVALIEFHREIDTDQHRYFKNRFEAAKRSGADLLIVEIDSPGGLKIESLEMSRMLRDCKWAYTVVLITREAISGGALIALGADEIIVSQNAKFGDIGEIQFDMDQMAFRLIEPKIESYLSRDARDIAESKGRPPALAEAMVDKDALVYLNEQGEEPEFKIVRSDADDKPEAPWALVEETGPERFLTVSGKRARDLGIAQGFAENREELANDLGFALADTRVYRRTTTDRVVHVLNWPLVTGLLVVVGLVSLFVEFSAPGIGIGGLLACLCACLFFWSRFLGGTSGWLEVILFVAGLLFLATELFIIPGFGIPGLMGILLMLASFILACQDFVVPTNSVQTDQFLWSFVTLAGSSIAFIAVAIFVTKRVGTMPLLKGLVLEAPAVDTAPAEKENRKSATAQTHPEISVGDWGKSESVLRPAGRAIFAGRSFDVISDGGFIKPDEQVKIIRIQGSIVTVAKIHDPIAETKKPDESDA